MVLIRPKYVFALTVTSKTMIHYIKGNLLESEAEALVNTVNTVGVMGKGIALRFKNRFPNNFKAYQQACKQQELQIGQLFVFEEETITGNKLIINFPTKTHWRLPSEYDYISQGLETLANLIQKRTIRSVAIPPLGAGNRGLNWEKVRQLIEQYLTQLDCDIYIYEPGAVIVEHLKKEKVKLTSARAMLLAVLYDLVRYGAFVAEFSAEKVVYFLQRFGANDTFKLTFKPNFYSPYSGKVRHLLHHLNGNYLTGYSAKDKKPFGELSLMMDTESSLSEYLAMPENHRYKATVERTKDFLSGFYGAFSLELLSTVDFIVTEQGVSILEGITEVLHQWNNHKKSLFTNQRFVEIALQNLKTHLP